MNTSIFRLFEMFDSESEFLIPHHELDSKPIELGVIYLKWRFIYVLFIQNCFQNFILYGMTRVNMETLKNLDISIDEAIGTFRWGGLLGLIMMWGTL